MELEKVQVLRIPLEKIKSATDNFSDEKLIATGGFGKVYKCILTVRGQQDTVAAVKRLDRIHGQGDREFLMEIQTLSSLVHENIVTLLGFCEESNERILVYKHVQQGGLDNHISDPNLSWAQRLKISVGAARGLSYLHNDAGPQHRILHCDIKSSNILLDENWDAKVSDFGLAKMHPSYVDQLTGLVTNPIGTMGYVDPQYVKTCYLTQGSDVYSFGVVLFELLCGRLAYKCVDEKEHWSLASVAPQAYEENRLRGMVPSHIKNEMTDDSFEHFSKVAYDCLNEKRINRPPMASVLEQLQKALDLQVKLEKCIRLAGNWGKQKGGDHNWSFQLEQGHKLQKISVDYDDDVIYSLMFTTECGGVLHNSSTTGGNGGKRYELTFDLDEKIIGVNGSIGTRDEDSIISSLSFKTNKTNPNGHGPFGRESESMFTIPLDEGSIVGFYGTAGKYIDAMGVYVKPDDEIVKVGTWGNQTPGNPENYWSFQLEKHHHLTKITINHGDLIRSLKFTTQYRGKTYTSKKAGGANRDANGGANGTGENVSKVEFGWGEEIVGIRGTFDETAHSIITIASLTFITNKKPEGWGPYGKKRGKPFTLTWDDGSFAGFYGRCGWYVDSIGVYLKAK